MPLKPGLRSLAGLVAAKRQADAGSSPCSGPPVRAVSPRHMGGPRALARYALGVAIAAVAGSSAFGAAPVAAETAPASPAVCSQARLQEILGPGATVETVAKVAASAAQPAYCAVTGYIERGGKIGFTLGLPDQWNRKFLFF